MPRRPELLLSDRPDAESLEPRWFGHGSQRQFEPGRGRVVDGPGGGQVQQPSWRIAEELPCGPPLSLTVGASEDVDQVCSVVPVVEEQGNGRDSGDPLE